MDTNFLSSLSEKRNFKAPEFILLSLLVSLAYFGSGTLGLMLAVPPGYATAVFPPAGVALAATLLLGYRIFPAILLGSALMNLSLALKSAPFSLSALLLSLGIGLGAALQAAAGAKLIRKFIGTFGPVRDEKSVLTFLALSGPIGSMVNATLSISLLAIVGILPSGGYLYNWTMWWIGDAIGAMVFTPLILAVFEPPLTQWSPRKVLTIVPSSLLFAVVVVFFFFASRQLDEKLKLQFQQKVAGHPELIVGSIGRAETVLAHIERLFSTMDFIGPEQFKSFVQSALKSLNGVTAIEWIPRIPDSERIAFEQRARKSGLLNFQIKDLAPDRQSIFRSPERPVYYPVFYLEPFEENRKALGLDFNGQDARRLALEKSIATRKAVATAKVRIIQEEEKKEEVIEKDEMEKEMDKEMEEVNSFILLYPVFKKKNPDVLMGFSAGVFRIRDIVTAALSKVDLEGVNFAIYDETDGRRDFLYQNIDPGDREKYPTPADLEKNRPSKFLATFPIEFASRKWRIEFFPTQNYIMAGTDLTAWAILVGGLILVILLQSLLMVILWRTEMVQALVVQKTAELAATNKELERFAYITSHDLQAPLRHISAYGNLLKGKLQGSGDEEVGEWLGYILNGVNRMKRLIDDLLDFSKIGRSVLTMEEIDLKALLSEVKQELEVPLNEAKASLGELPLLRVRANKTLLMQLFENLLGNAIKFRSNERFPKIEITATEDPDYWDFRVKDNGIGFDMRHADRIFDVFQRLHKQSEYEGTGIGLSICKKIVEIHGGKIEAKSVPGQGTEFHFKISKKAAA